MYVKQDCYEVKHWGKKGTIKFVKDASTSWYIFGTKLKSSGIEGKNGKNWQLHLWTV